VATGELFEDLLVNQQLLSVLEPDADVLDALIVDDQRDRVVASCCGAISEQAADPETWARLSLAHRNEQSFAAFSLVRFPEFVMSLYGEIADRSAQPPDPMEIAAWLAPRLLSHDEQDFVPAPLDNSDATPSSFGFL
jgi:hypothetical protein